MFSTFNKYGTSIISIDNIDIRTITDIDFKDILRRFKNIDYLKNILNEIKKTKTFKIYKNILIESGGCTVFHDISNNSLLLSHKKNDLYNNEIPEEIHKKLNVNIDIKEKITLVNDDNNKSIYLSDKCIIEKDGNKYSIKNKEYKYVTEYIHIYPNINKIRKYSDIIITCQ